MSRVVAPKINPLEHRDYQRARSKKRQRTGGSGGASSSAPSSAAAAASASAAKGASRSRRREKEATNTLVSEAWHDVLKIGKTGLASWQQKAQEEERVVSLGGRKAKGEKTPLPILLGINKARKRRADRADDEAKQSGVVTARQSKKSAAAAASRAGGRGRFSRSVGVSGPVNDMGGGRSGTLNISRAYVAGEKSGAKKRKGKWARG